MSNEFSVCTFFEDGTYVYEEPRFVSAVDAVRKAKDVSARPAAQTGIIAKVIITDGGDFTVFVWEHGKGVTFP